MRQSLFDDKPAIQQATYALEMRWRQALLVALCLSGAALVVALTALTLLLLR